MNFGTGIMYNSPENPLLRERRKAQRFVQLPNQLAYGQEFLHIQVEASLALSDSLGSMRENLEGARGGKT
jgi:hypothetical protein